MLLARLAGGFQAPLTKAAGLFQAFTRNLAYGVKALIDQRVAGGEALPEPTEEAPRPRRAAAAEAPQPRQPRHRRPTAEAPEPTRAAEATEPEAPRTRPRPSPSPNPSSSNTSNGRTKPWQP